MFLTDDQIDDLITCPKIITKCDRTSEVIKERHRRRDFDLQSKNKEHKFRAFFRQSIDFPDSFSVGLVYCIPENGESITLLRCNGKHGPTREIKNLHSYFHIHKATSKSIIDGKRPESEVEVTNSYGSYAAAKNYFIDYCRIINASDFVPNDAAKHLFDVEELEND